MFCQMWLQNKKHSVFLWHFTWQMSNCIAAPTTSPTMASPCLCLHFKTIQVQFLLEKTAKSLTNPVSHLTFRMEEFVHHWLQTPAPHFHTPLDVTVLLTVEKRQLHALMEESMKSCMLCSFAPQHILSLTGEAFVKWRG